MQTPNNRRTFLRQSAASVFAVAIADRLAGIQESFAATTSHIHARTESEFEELGNEYLLDPEITYLNHASIGTTPKPVMKARREYLELCESNPWLYMWGGVWDEAREDVRAICAEVLGCESSEVAINHNTTEVFNLLAHGLPLGKGDEVLFSSLCHVGACQAFKHMAPVRGFKARQFDFPIEKVPAINKGDVIDVYLSQVTPSTKLVVIPHIDNTVGIRYPVDKLCRELKKAGVNYVAVDAAQSVGMIPVNVSDWNADVVATSPHKWLQTPKGLGLSFIDKELHEVLNPMWVTWGQDRWPKSARRFEDYGTRNMAEVLTLKNAIEFHMTLTPKSREKRLSDLWNYAEAKVKGHPDLSWHSPPVWCSSGSLFAVEVSGKASGAIAADLFAESGVVVRPFATLGLNTLRVSPNVFTRKEQLDRFFDLISS